MFTVKLIQEYSEESLGSRTTIELLLRDDKRVQNLRSGKGITPHAAVKQPIYKNSWRWTCKCLKHVQAIYENKIIVTLFASSWYIFLTVTKIFISSQKFFKYGRQWGTSFDISQSVTTMNVWFQIFPKTQLSYKICPTVYRLQFPRLWKSVV